MSRKRKVAFITLIILLLSAIAIAGLFNIMINIGRNQTAIKVALEYPDIASELNSSNNDYQVKASPADPSITGYYNYSDTIYEVTIDTANLGSGLISKNYLGHFKVLVDIDRQQVMAIQYSYDVATMPWHIVLPAYAIWYQQLCPSSDTFNGTLKKYIEMNLSTLNQSIHPVVVNYENSMMAKDSRPYMAFWLTDLGENATVIDYNRINPALETVLETVTVVPGRMPIPGDFINGSGASFAFLGPGHGYYFLAINYGPTDATIDVMIL